MDRFARSQKRLVRNVFYGNDDGLAGARVLKRFDLWLDYPNSRIIFARPEAH